MQYPKTKLSVNINKVATLRNARGGNNPNVVQVAIDCERFGAQGITVHPRPDGRHIRYQDVLDLSRVVTTEFNIEGYPDEDFLTLVERTRPNQCTLVPDPPSALTSNAGWDTRTHERMLRDVIERLHRHDIRVSLFVEPTVDAIRGAHQCGTDRVELYTEVYAREYRNDREVAIAPYVVAAEEALALGVGLNAGHDLDLENLHFLSTKLEGLLEVSIGHALIADALYYGLENTIQLYLRELR